MKPLWPPKNPATLQVFWSVLVSNTGERKLSIVDYAVEKESARNEPWPIYLNRRLYLNGGIFNVDGQPLSLPVALGPGESLKLSLKVGLVVDPKAYSVLSKKYGFDELLPLDEVVAELAKSGIDIYGNRVSIINYSESGAVNLEAPDPRKREETIRVKFRTAKGSVFSDTSSWYDHEGGL